MVGIRGIMFATMCFIIFTCSAFAETLGPLEYEIVGGLVTITGCDEAVTNVVVPAVIDDRPVTSLRLAFHNQKALTSVSLPVGLREVGPMAFAGCSSLKAVHIPDGVVHIGECAFFGCNSLTSVQLPEGLETIGSGAFVGCGQWHGIDRITIPRTVSHIGSGAFQSCAVSSLLVEEGNKHYISENNALFNAERTELVACLRGVSGSYTVPDGIAEIGDQAFSGCFSLKAVQLPSSLRSIGAHAFDGCGALREITIPSGVTNIGVRAFWFCRKLESFSVEEGSRAYSDVEGVLFNHDKTKLIACPKTLTGTYVVPGGVIEIGENAFGECTSLEKIVLPEGLRGVDKYAFSSCYSLEEITFPGSVNRIGDDAFSCCGKLHSVTFLGDAPEEFGLTVFFRMRPEFRIYRRQDSKGFDTPRWQGHRFMVSEDAREL